MFSDEVGKCMKEMKMCQIDNAIVRFEDVRSKILVIRNLNVILDSDVAILYGIETRRVNEAVRNNLDKFPSGYMFRLSNEEFIKLRSKFSTSNITWKRRSAPIAFTEKGLYMLATILKSRKATNTTFAIIETFAAVRELKREIVELHNEPSSEIQQSKMEQFGKILSDIVMPDLETTATESTLELNFFIGKLKHTVKRVRRSNE